MTNETAINSSCLYFCLGFKPRRRHVCPPLSFLSFFFPRRCLETPLFCHADIYIFRFVLFWMRFIVRSWQSLTALVKVGVEMRFMRINTSIIFLFLCCLICVLLWCFSFKLAFSNLYLKTSTRPNTLFLRSITSFVPLYTYSPYFSLHSQIRRWLLYSLNRWLVLDTLIDPVGNQSIQ